MRTHPQGTTATIASPHRGPLEALGLAEPGLGRLVRYLDTLSTWNRRVNLTAARSPAERVQLLVARVLPALRFVEPGTLLDVGSGNGSPGLVFALLCADLRVTLLEPRLRRWAFLREAARAAGAPQVEILRERHDTYPGPPAHTVTLRALSLTPSALEPLVERGGLLIVLGAKPRTAAPFEAEGDTPEGIHVFRRAPVSRET